MNEFKTRLNQKLSEVMTTKRLRSSKWFSTTYHETDERSRYVSHQYFADNLVQPVLFSDALKQMPKDVIVIEVSPHQLFQSIIKRSLGSDITYIPLMKKYENNINFLLESVGRLYSCGVNTKIENFYPKVEYPVSRGTPALSPLVNWDHSQNYKVYEYPDYFNPIRSTDSVKIDLQTKKDEYISGHCIDGRILFPATGYLLLAWKHLAKQLGKSIDEVPVEFENVKLHRATIIPKVGIIKFVIRILETSGHFDITESGTVVVTGRIFMPNMATNRFEYLLNEEREIRSNFLDEETEIVLKSKDIYKELRLRGYDYGNTFQCLTKAVVLSHGVRAAIKWTNWVSFIDSMIQMSILGKRSPGLYLPVHIDYLRCDPRELTTQTEKDSNGSSQLAFFDSNLGICVCKGLEFKGVKTNLAPRKISQMPLIEKYCFVPYDEEECQIKSSYKQYLDQYMRQCHKLALDLMQKFKISPEGLTSDVSSDLKIEFEEDSKNLDIMANKAISVGNESEQHLFQLLLHLNCIENNEINSKIFEDFKEKVIALDNDLLNKSFVREEVLRQQLETVIENLKFNSNRINVLEVSKNQAIIAQNVIGIIRSSAFDLNINYSLLHPMIANITNDFGQEIECHHWDVEKSRLPSELNNFDLILYEDTTDLISPEFQINLSTLFGSLWNSVKENGFLIVINKIGLTFPDEVIIRISDIFQNNNTKNKLTNDILWRKTQIISEAKRAGFSFIGNKTDGISNKCSLIFRKINIDFRLTDQTFIRITNEKCDQWIAKLQNELRIIESRPQTENIWLLGDDCPTNGIIGFVKCLRKEPNGHRIRCIFNIEENGSESNLNIDPINNTELLENIVKRNLVMNVIKSGNRIGSFTHFTIDLNGNTVPSKHCYLNVQTKGDLSSFKWFEAQHKYWPLGKKNNQQLIDVYYAPLNFKDVMLSTGKLPPDALPDDQGLEDCVLGFEFAGRDENNNRVMGMTPCKAMATTIVIEENYFLWRIPQHWSMEEASTVPVVYATAYYALVVRGKLKPKESVLIHSGSGGVGQAAIAICLSMDCQLLITCGSDAKREFLKKEFSPKLCDTNFWTSRDSSFESFAIRETNGRGVDVVLNSLSEEKLQASLRCLATNGRFLEIGKYDLSQNNELDISNLLRNKTFHGIVLDSLFVADGPLSRAHKLQIRQFIESGISDGTVRPLQTTVFDSSQVEQAFRFMASGKHIGKVVLKIRDETFLNELLKFPAIPRTVFKHNKSYLIIGGLGGFGLELANWMIERGAMNLLLTSRSGLITPYQKHRVKYFKELGINVEISTKDVSDLSQTLELMNYATNIGSAQGLGGIFNSALVLSDALFEKQTSEEFERVMAPKARAIRNLDQLSRELCSELDYFVCFSSISCGRGNPGQTNYGFANSVMERVCEERRMCGLSGLAIQWGPIGDVGVVAETLCDGNDMVIAGALPQRMVSCLATLNSLLQMEYSVLSSIVRADHKAEISNNKGDLIKTIAHILGLKDYGNLDSKLTLGELGMDSLMSVEVKQTLEREYDLVHSSEEIRKLSLGQIGAIAHKNDLNSK